MKYRIVFDHLPENDYQPALWRLQERRWWGWETLAVNNILRIETLIKQIRQAHNIQATEYKRQLLHERFIENDLDKAENDIARAKAALGEGAS